MRVNRRDRTAVPLKSGLCPEAKEAKMSVNDEFLTRQEAASLLRLNIKTVDRYRQRGALPAQRLLGRSVRFRRDDVLKLVRT